MGHPGLLWVAPWEPAGRALRRAGTGHRPVSETDVLDALQQMLQTGRGRLLGFEGQSPRGLLTHTGVTWLLQGKMALGV